MLLALVACHREAAPPPPATIRCAVIGGMLETGFWSELTARYEQLTGRHVVLAASGPKGTHDAEPLFYSVDVN